MITYLIICVCVYFTAVTTAFCVDMLMRIVDHNLEMNEKHGDVDQIEIENNK